MWCGRQWVHGEYVECETTLRPPKWEIQYEVLHTPRVLEWALNQSCVFCLHQYPDAYWRHMTDDVLQGRRVGWDGLRNKIQGSVENWGFKLRLIIIQRAGEKKREVPQMPRREDSRIRVAQPSPNELGSIYGLKVDSTLTEMRQR